MSDRWRGCLWQGALALGCSLALAAVISTVFLVIALMSNGGNVRESAGVAGMAAAITPVATIILIGLDNWRWGARWRRVRRWLSSRVDISMDSFAASFPSSDRELVLHLRDRLAAFFGEPGNKIDAGDRLEQFGFDEFMPDIYAFLMAKLCDEHGIEIIGPIPKSRLATVSDLPSEAKALLKDAPS